MTTYSKGNVDSVKRIVSVQAEMLGGSTEELIDAVLLINKTETSLGRDSITNVQNQDASASLKMFSLLVTISSSHEKDRRRIGNYIREINELLENNGSSCKAYITI